MKSMKKVRAFIAALTSLWAPQMRLRSLLPELKRLREELRPLPEKNDKLQALIDLFNVISPWYDRGGLRKIISSFERVNYGQHDRILKVLEVIDYGIHHAGRVHGGWNRTKNGERATEHNVYLGGVWGVWTFTIAHFRSVQNSSRTPWGGGTGKPCNAYDIVVWSQAEPMVEKVVKNLTEAIDFLEAPRHRPLPAVAQQTAR